MEGDLREFEFTFVLASSKSLLIEKTGPSLKLARPALSSELDLISCFSRRWPVEMTTFLKRQETERGSLDW